MVYNSSILIFFKTSYLFIYFNNHLMLLSYILDKYRVLNIYSFNKHRFDKLNSLNSSRFIYRKLNLSYYIKLYYYNIVLIFWSHLIFKGKSYRIRAFKKNKKLTLYFGYSHWLKVKFSKKWALLKRRRQNYLIYGSKLRDFKYWSQIFSKLRVMNRYTLRGLRLRKQFIKKRFGKISQYISSLH